MVEEDFVNADVEEEEGDDSEEEGNEEQDKEVLGENSEDSS